MFYQYLFSYFILYFGFLLGKSTKDEHKEVKRYVLLISNLLKIAFYGILFYFSASYSMLYMFFALFILYVLSLALKNKDTMKFHDIVLLGVSFLFLQNVGLFFLLILMFAFVFENSFRKFDVKEEVYSVILYLIVYVLFGILY